MKRYAIYYAPEPGGWADAAAVWLGWDPATGQRVAQPADVPALPDLTAEPQRYGFHGTIKPPFRLAEGLRLADLKTAVAQLAGRLRPVVLDGLDLVDLEGFLALVPRGDTAALTALAAEVVASLEPARAALTAAEVARRRPERLTPRQRGLLELYGYPYVMDEFRFHLTLSGRLTPADRDALMPAAAAHFAPHLPQPFRIAELCLFGEDAAGWFHLLHRYALTA